MAVPSANELQDWLEQLPPGYADEIQRRGDPDEVPVFEVWNGKVRMQVQPRPGGSPAVRLLASAAIPRAVETDTQFQLACWQAVAATPGYSQRVEGDHPMAAGGVPSVLLHYPVYEDAVSKQTVLSTLVTLADTARVVTWFAEVCSRDGHSGTSATPP